MGTLIDKWHSKEVVKSVGGLLTDRYGTKIKGSLVSIGDYSLSACFSFKFDKFSWLVTNVYGPHNHLSRKSQFDELRIIRLNYLSPYCRRL